MESSRYSPKFSVMANKPTNQSPVDPADEIATLKASLATAQQENKEAKQANDLLRNELSQVKERYEVLVESADVLLQEKEANTAIIEALEAELKELKAADPTAPKLATLGAKKYRVVVPVFYHKREMRTAEEVLNNEELLAELVAKKSGVIAEVEE